MEPTAFHLFSPSSSARFPMHRVLHCSTFGPHPFFRRECTSNVKLPQNNKVNAPHESSQFEGQPSSTDSQKYPMWLDISPVKDDIPCLRCVQINLSTIIMAIQSAPFRPTRALFPSVHGISFPFPLPLRYVFSHQGMTTSRTHDPA